MMPKFLTLIAVLIVCVLAVTYDRWHVPDAPERALKLTNINAANAPSIAFKTLDGIQHQLRNLPEQGIILHFWASWCAPCMLEFPSLLKRVADEKGRLALVAVSIDDNRDAMNAFLNHLKRTQPDMQSGHVYWVWDDEKTISLKFFNVIRVPETVLIDTKRRMVRKIIGNPDWASDAVGRQLHALVRVQSP